MRRTKSIISKELLDSTIFEDNLYNEINVIMTDKMSNDDTIRLINLIQELILLKSGTTFVEKMDLLYEISVQKNNKFWADFAAKYIIFH